MNRRCRIDLVMPDLFDRQGGIARVGRISSMAIAAFCERNGLKATVHVLHDRGDGRDTRYVPEGVEYQAYRSSRVKLARSLVRRALTSEHLLTVFFHVHLAATMGLLPKRIRGEYVVVAHGVEVWKRLPLHRRLALRNASQLWAVSDYSARQLIALNGVDPKRVYVIPNALDPCLETSIDGDGDCRAEPFILTISRLSRGDAYKGVDNLLCSFRDLASEFPSLRIVVVGEGDDLDRLRSIVGSASLDTRVEFRNRVTDAELAELYRRCALFALPSKKEGFGLVLLEAMRAGKAVVAVAAGGAPEVVDTRSGILVPPDDQPALTNALRHVLSDAALAKTMGSEGRRRAMNLFSYDAYRRRVSSALAPLVGTLHD